MTSLLEMKAVYSTAIYKKKQRPESRLFISDTEFDILCLKPKVYQDDAKSLSLFKEYPIALSQFKCGIRIKFVQKKKGQAPNGHRFTDVSYLP